MSTLTAVGRSICIHYRFRSAIAAQRFGRIGSLQSNAWIRRVPIKSHRTFTSRTRPDVDGQEDGDFLQDSLKQLEDQLQALDDSVADLNLSSTTSAALSDAEPQLLDRTHDYSPSPLSTTEPEKDVSSESIVRQARDAFGDTLPENFLNQDELKIYERLYGTPLPSPRPADAAVVDFDTQESQGELDEQDTVGTGLLKEGKDGQLEELEHIPEEYEDEYEDGMEDAEQEDVDEALDPRELLRLEKSKKGRFFIKATKHELDAAILGSKLSRTYDESLIPSDEQEEWEALDEVGRTMYLDDIRYLRLEKELRDDKNDSEANELLQFLFIRYRSMKEAELKSETEDVVATQSAPDESVLDTADHMPEGEGNTADGYQRRHPLSSENRFGTSPSTIQISKNTFVDPITAIISGSSPKHLASAAHKIFGGVGLPYSTSNPALARTMQQKPIALDASQSKMTEIEADAYFAVVMPGVYASVSSVMVETRKRLGSEWLERLLSKDGGPRILDAGGAGAGILAVREVLRAEWERMNDTTDDPDSPLDLTIGTGRIGGAPMDAPTGKATVLTVSDTLRQRASVLLDDTTFLPRLPDYLHASNEQAREKGKFDIIVAPHTLWPLKEDYIRRQHMSNLWSLLSADGGVLLLIEKGVPRGFEMIAGAREYLLNSRISSSGQEEKAEDLTAPGEGSLEGLRPKETGMIVAPCTNHTSCPMYVKSGTSKGRKDYCHFEQRFIRPPFLQKVIGAKDKNFEDVQFSYVSVMRGRDLRHPGEDALVQGDEATDRAFSGFEKEVSQISNTETEGRTLSPHSLSLPRAVMPPLKRTGHVILDLCTPSGTLERWTVPRSFSKQAFRDARKSSWGDLWAMGAKTRVAKGVRLGQGKEELGAVDNARSPNAKVKARDRDGRAKPKRTSADYGFDSGYDVVEDENERRIGGRLRQGKVGGIRDKRDKSGTGRGRRKAMMDA